MPGVPLHRLVVSPGSMHYLSVQGCGMTSLEEAVLAQAELCDLKGDQQGGAEGVVIETRMDRGLG